MDQPEKQLMSQAALAKHFHVHPSRIQALSAQGRIELVARKGRSCMYDLAEVEAALKDSFTTTHISKISKIISKDGSVKKLPSDQPTLHESRTLNEKLKAELKQIEIDKKKGELVFISDVKREWVTHINATKIQMLGLSSKIKPTLDRYITDHDSTLKVLKEIDKIIKEALTELSE